MKDWVESLRKKQEKEKKMAEAADRNPYFAGKQRYINIYEGLADNVQQWKQAFWVIAVLLCVSVSVNIIQATKTNRVVPYVVEVDKIGQIFPVAPATRTDVDNRIISAQVGEFIINSRTRVLDKSAQLYFIKQSYRSIAKDSAANQKLNTYYVDDIPTNATSPTTVRVNSIISVSEKTYSAEWSEETEISGGAIEEKRYKGLFEISVSPPKDTKNLISNPLGVYIMDYQISEELM